MFMSASYACGKQVGDKNSIKSFRLMAVVVGHVASVESLDLHGMTHQQIGSNAVNLRLLVFVVLTEYMSAMIQWQ